MAPGALTRPGRVPKQRLSIPRISPSVAAALWNFSWISDCLSRVFASGGLYRRRRQGRWPARGPTPCPGAAWAGPHQGGCGHPVAPLRLSFWLHESSRKIGTLAFVPSNFENIHFLTFLEPKTAENRQLALWHLVNRLVQESV